MGSATSPRATRPTKLPRRAGAYSAAVQGRADITHIRILAGHRVGGMSDAYIMANPAMVSDACEAIERHYFPTVEPAPKSKSKGKSKGKGRK